MVNPCMSQTIEEDHSREEIMSEESNDSDDTSQTVDDQ